MICEIHKATFLDYCPWCRYKELEKELADAKERHDTIMLRQTQLNTQVIEERDQLKAELKEAQEDRDTFYKDYNSAVHELFEVRDERDTLRDAVRAFVDKTNDQWSHIPEYDKLVELVKEADDE